MMHDTYNVKSIIFTTIYRVSAASRARFILMFRRPLKLPTSRILWGGRGKLWDTYVSRGYIKSDGWMAWTSGICLRRYEQRKECLKSYTPNCILLSGFSTDIFRTFFCCNMPTIYTPVTNFSFIYLQVLITIYHEVYKLRKYPLRTFLHLPVIFCILQDSKTHLRVLYSKAFSLRLFLMVTNHVLCPYKTKCKITSLFLHFSNYVLGTEEGNCPLVVQLMAKIKSNL